MRDAQQLGAAALESLLATLRPPLFAFYANRLSPDTAEDLTQVALLRIARAVDRIDPGRADAYIGTIARNLLRSAYRRQARESSRRVSAELSDFPTPQDRADTVIERDELIRALYRVAAAGLSPEQFDLLVGVLEGMTTAELATRYGVSPITIRTRLLRVRALLRRGMRPYVDAPPEEDQQAG